MYLDFHTHFANKNSDEISIFNFILEKTRIESFDFQSQNAFSMGIHPWFIVENDVDFCLDFIEKNARNPNFKLIGEAGLDKIKGPDFDLQKEVFVKQIALSEKLQKPLVIHCVKAFNEIVELKAKYRPKVPWIIHGFNKKKELAQELIKKGFYLSFGKDLLEKKHVQEAFLVCPLERVFLETDDVADLNIKEIYQKAEMLLSQKIKEKIFQNYIELKI